MCGRYYVDDDTAREIEKLIRQVDEKMRKAENIHLRAGDIHPSEIAPVIAADHKDLCCKWQRWGFPGFSGKRLIFNARSESALEKKMFKESVETGESLFRLHGSMSGVETKKRIPFTERDSLCFTWLDSITAIRTKTGS